MTDLLLVRHGETDWNRERRWQGGANDLPLNERGREQARGLAANLAGTRVDAVYSSDLARARETAEIVATATRAPIVLVPELREIDIGEWSGRTRDEIERDDPTAIERAHELGYGWLHGETPEELGVRVLGAVRKIAADRPDGCVVVVAHGWVIRALGALAAGRTYLEHRRLHPVVGNCSVTRLRCENGDIRSLD